MRQSSRRSFQGVLAGVIASGFALTSIVGTVDAAPPTGYETGYEFQEFHQQSGGVSAFGYAMSPRVVENGNVVQYFERQRFESKPTNPADYQIELGRLGAEEADSRKLRGSDAFAPRSEAEADRGDCIYFEKTGHSVCNGFKDRWGESGLALGDRGVSSRESLALFGYPISSEFVDESTGRTVQYFERARFEYHPEQAGTGNDVLLGRLGSPAWKSREATAELAPEVVAEPAEQMDMQTQAGSGIADLATSLVGSPYVWGATGPGSFDCSGFIYYVINQQTGGGYPRDMYSQAATGQPVAPENLQPGDVVFQQNTYRAGLSHAGIYIGSGQFVHAANPGDGVIVSDLWGSYWGSKFHSARRIN